MRLPAAIPAVLGVALALACNAVPAREPTGAELAGRLGCCACHALHGRGGKLAPPLDGIGSRLSRQDLQVMLTYPRRLHPGARMPSYAYLPPAAREALADFLQTRK